MNFLRIILIITFLAAINYILPPEMQLVLFAGSQLFANGGTLLIFFLRSLRIFKNTNGWIYYFFAAWQIWLLILGMYFFFTDRDIRVTALVFLFLVNLLLASIIIFDIIRKNKSVHGI